MVGEIAREVLRRTQKPSRIRYGSVEAVGADGLASVRMGSTVVDNVAWCRGYAPVVGERVAALASGTGWLILDAVESVQRAYNEPETVLVHTSHRGGIVNWQWSDSWDDNLNTPEHDPKPPQPNNYPGWRNLYASPTPLGGENFDSTGYHYTPSGDRSVLNYVPSNGYKALFLWYPDLATQVPSNAVIQSASLVLRMWDPEPPWQGKATTPAQDAQFGIYAHSQGTSNTAQGNPPEYYFNDSYGSMESGMVHPGDSLVIPLSDDWVNGLISGDLRGLALWPGLTTKRIAFSDERTFAPHPKYADSWVITYVTHDCFSLQVTYITPVEED